MSFIKANDDYYSEDKDHEFYDDNIDVEYGKDPESEEIATVKWKKWMKIKTHKTN